MKKRLVVLATVIVFGIAMLVPTIALAGGDQVQRPAETPQHQDAGTDPNQWQLQSSR